MSLVLVAISVAGVRVMPLFTAVAVGVSCLVGATVVVVLELAVLVLMFQPVLPAFLEKFVPIKRAVIV